MSKAIGLICCSTITVIATVSFSQPAAIPANKTVRPVPVRVSTRPVTMRELVKAADRIFIGTPSEVVVRPERLTGVERETPVQTVTFQVEQVLKTSDPSLAPGKPYVVKQLANVSHPIKTGERLLWYLAPNDPSLNLTQPVGIDSGHFMISKDGKSAINLQGNKNLFNVPGLKENVKNIIAHVPDDHKQMLESHIMALHENDFSTPGKSVPLALIVARTKSLLSGK